MTTDTLVLERPIKIINLWKETRKRGTGRASRRVVLNCTRGLYSRTRARVKNGDPRSNSLSNSDPLFLDVSRLRISTAE